MNSNLLWCGNCRGVMEHMIYTDHNQETVAECQALVVIHPARKVQIDLEADVERAKVEVQQLRDFIQQRGLNVPDYTYDEALYDLLATSFQKRVQAGEPESTLYRLEPAQMGLCRHAVKFPKGCNLNECFEQHNQVNKVVVATKEEEK